MGAGKIYDFTGVSPEGMPPEVRCAIREAADHSDMLPEDLEERLGEALSRSLHIPADHICVSGGTASMVYRIIFAFRPRRALVVVPTWTLYEKALKQYGCEVTEYVLSESGGFQPDDSLRSMIWEHSYDMIFLANPSDPTGTLMTRELLADLLYTCQKTGTRVVLDECLMDMVMDQEKFSLLPSAVGMNDVFVLKSFSASYAMAGIRLGYAICGNTEDALCLRDRTGDRSLSVPAFCAGIAALGSTEISDSTRVYIAMERERITAGLLAAGLRVYPSRASFLMLRSPWDLRLYLDGFGIRLKEVTGIPGLSALSGYFYRVGVRSREENQYLVECLTHAARELDRIAPAAEGKHRGKEQE